MINAIIIEDEVLAQEKLLHTLKEVCPEIRVNAILNSVKQSIDFFRRPTSVDIIFSDVQLPDGLSFEIFSETQIKIPVIFTTGYDKFMVAAFENNGIDYLIKPISGGDLSKALSKYRMLENHFAVQNKSLKNLIDSLNPKKRTRLVVKKGIENISVRLNEIVMFYTENKMVYVIDNNGKKYISDKTLNELEVELDDSNFFRANRQYIINLDFVKSYKPYEKVKLQVDLSFSEKEHFIIISQVTAPQFRKWISES